MRQPARERLPGVAAVGRLEEAARRAYVRVVVFPRPLPRGPQRGVDRPRVRRIERDVDSARVLVLVEDALHRASAVGGAVDAALRVRAVGMPERRDEDAVRIVWIDDEGGDLPRVAQAVEVLPGAARVVRSEEAFADGEIRPLQPFAARDVDDVRVRRRDGDGANRLRRLLVEDRRPGLTVVRSLPDAAVVRADVEHVRLLGHACGADGPAAAKRPDVAPAQRREERRLHRLRAQRDDGGGDDDDDDVLHPSIKLATPVSRLGHGPATPRPLPRRRP